MVSIFSIFNSQIIMIDPDINNSENNKYIQELKGMDSADFLLFKEFDQIDKAINYMKKTNSKNTTVIINGSLYSKFIQSLKQNTTEFIFTPEIIVFTKNKKDFIQNHPELKQLKDLNDFYKFKGIATSIEEIKQLLNNEYQPQINGHISTDLQLKFEYIDKKEKIILPLYFKALIDKAKNDDDKKFIEYLYNKYSKSNPKLKPVLDCIKSMTNFQIDELSKYYVRLYTIESDFYRDLNKDLRLKKREQYMPYIKTLYEGIKEKALPLSSDNMLYRGTSILKVEIEKLKGYLQNKIKGLPSSIVFCRSFLSFSKDKKVAVKFFNNFSNNKDLCRVLFTLEKDDNIGFDLSTHCDIEKLSVLRKEKEVLFLPFSSFEVKEMKEININNENTYEIKLLYLGRYLKKIEANKNLYLSENKLPDSEFKKELSEFGMIPKDIIENMTIKKIFNSF